MTDRQHIGALDGLRGLAALTVLVSHLSNQTRVFDAMLGEGAGQLGVMLFFALSGFLMMRLYAQATPSRSTILDFYQRRIARVFPLYLLLVGFSFLLVSVLQSTALYNIDSANLAEHLLFLHGESFLWTVPVEVQFYLVFPVLWWVAARYGVGWIALMLTAMAAFTIAGKTTITWLPHHLPYFLLGMILARSTIRMPVWTPYVCLAVYVLAFPRIVAVAGIDGGDVWRSPSYLAIIGGLLLSAANSRGSFFESAPLRFTGRISYSLYLLHAPIIAWFAATPVASNNPVFIPAVLVASICLATLSYLLIEAPARKFLSKRVRRIGISHAVRPAL